MLKELEEIAEEHESLSQKKSSSKVIAILEVEVKGKKLQLNLLQNTSSEVLVQEFIRNNKLSQKSFQPLLLKVNKMLEDCKNIPYSLSISFSLLLFLSD